MHQKFNSFLVFIALTLSLLACSEKNNKIQLDQNSVILAFGDSLTQGVGTSQDKSYPSVLSEILGIEVINKGISGETSSQGLKRFRNVLKQTTPDLVILCHGGNDILRKLPLEKLRSNLQQMIDIAHSNGAEVMLIGVPKPAIFLSPLPLYEEVAEDNQLVTDLSTLSELLGQPSMKSDGIHLNAKGYQALAQALAEKIQIN